MHTCISGEHDAWIGAQGKPIVMVAADQHFPPNLPTDGEGECIRILRVENGSLAEIAKELTLAAPADGMVPGSLVFLGAPAQLAVVSVEFYAAGGKKQGALSKQIWVTSWFCHCYHYRRRE
jgi:hypothetical protein